jgi:hypothetical protein
MNLPSFSIRCTSFCLESVILYSINLLTYYEIIFISDNFRNREYMKFIVNYFERYCQELEKNHEWSSKSISIERRVLGISLILKISILQVTIKFYIFILL